METTVLSISNASLDADVSFYFTFRFADARGRDLNGVKFGESYSMQSNLLNRRVFKRFFIYSSYSLAGAIQTRRTNAAFKNPMDTLKSVDIFAHNLIDFN